MLSNLTESQLHELHAHLHDASHSLYLAWNLLWDNDADSTYSTYETRISTARLALDVYDALKAKRATRKTTIADDKSGYKPCGHPESETECACECADCAWAAALPRPDNRGRGSAGAYVRRQPPTHRKVRT